MKEHPFLIWASVGLALASPVAWVLVLHPRRSFQRFVFFATLAVTAPFAGAFFFVALFVGGLPLLVSIGYVVLFAMSSYHVGVSWRSVLVCLVLLTLATAVAALVLYLVFDAYGEGFVEAEKNLRAIPSTQTVLDWLLASCFSDVRGVP